MRDGFLEFIHKRGRITDEQFEAICALRRTRSYFGIVALREDYVTPETLDNALQEQSRKQFRERIGAIMKRRNYMTDAQIEDVLRKQRDVVDTIGQLLVDMELLSIGELEQEIEAYDRTNAT